MTRDWAGNFIDLSENRLVPKIPPLSASAHERRACDLERAAGEILTIKPYAQSKSEKEALRRTRAALYRQIRQHRALARTVSQESERRGRS